MSRKRDREKKKSAHPRIIISGQSIFPVVLPSQVKASAGRCFLLQLICCRFILTFFLAMQRDARRVAAVADQQCFFLPPTSASTRDRCWPLCVGVKKREKMLKKDAAGWREDNEMERGG